MIESCGNCDQKLSPTDFARSNCGATCPSLQRVPARKYRHIILAVLVFIFILPILWFLISPFIAEMNLKKNTVNDNLNASTINFVVSCASALESATETLTGDDLTVTIKEAEVYYSCHSPLDGICLGYDYSDKNLRLTYTVSNSDHPSLDFDYTVRIPMQDGWTTSMPNFADLLEGNISTYLNKREALPSYSSPRS